MKFAFRCDASESIGSGHVMRCLTLAQALKTRGHEVFFVSADLPEFLKGRLLKQGFSHKSLERLPGYLPGYEPEELWCKRDQENDARSFIRLCSQNDIDWVIADHYGLDHSWSDAVRAAGYRVAMIEDWPHRKTGAELLIDPRPGAKGNDYNDYNEYHDTQRLMCGEQYNLIRPEFFESRCADIVDVNRVLINLGGMDERGLSAVILDNLKDAVSPDNSLGAVEYTVLVSPSSPSYLRIQSESDSYPFPVTLIDRCEDMVSLYQSHDVCIGAGGGSMWERIVMGLPTALMVIADNQSLQATSAEEAGLVKIVGDGQSGFAAEDFISLLADHQALASLQNTSRSFIECSGAENIVDGFENAPAPEFALRAATLNDRHVLYQWQSEPGARTFFRNAALPRWSEHQRWFAKRLSDSSGRLWIIDVGGVPSGYIRLDPSGRESFEVSVLVSRQFRGRGLAVRALNTICHRYADRKIVAEIAPGNMASRRTFLRAGFRKSGVMTHADKKRKGLFYVF